MRACTIVRPCTNTVDGAGTVVTLSNFSLGTSKTTISGFNAHNEVAGLGTISTSNRASSPFTELTFTVDGTRGEVTFAGVGVSISVLTGLTAILSFNFDGESTGLVTGTAHFLVGALIIVTERTFTVNRAGTHIAGLSLDFTIIVITFKTTILSSLSDRESSVDVSSGTGNITISEGTPFTFAMLRAEVGVA